VRNGKLGEGGADAVDFQCQNLSRAQTAKIRRGFLPVSR
jgi:hypothetical protein